MPLGGHQNHGLARGEGHGGKGPDRIGQRLLSRPPQPPMAQEPMGGSGIRRSCSHPAPVRSQLPLPGIACLRASRDTWYGPESRGLEVALLGLGAVDACKG